MHPTQQPEPNNVSISKWARNKSMETTHVQPVQGGIQTWDLRHDHYLNLQYDSLDPSATTAGFVQPFIFYLYLLSVSTSSESEWISFLPCLSLSWTEFLPESIPWTEPVIRPWLVEIARAKSLSPISLKFDGTKDWPLVKVPVKAKTRTVLA